MLATASAAHAADPWLTAAGRLHVALVHAPIGLLVTAALLEWARLLRRRERVSPASFACALFGALGAGAAVASGWVHADAEPLGGRSAELVEWHRWFGIGSAAAAGTAGAFAIAAWATGGRRARTAYSALALAAAMGVSVSAWLGARLVHGPGYFAQAWRPADAAAAGAPADPAAATPALPDPDPRRTSLRDAALAVFQARCVECHGPTKRKGGLRLDSAAHALAKPPDEAVIVTGDPDASPLFYRITLPPDDPDAMPPEGDRLSADQVEAIRAWIASLADAPPPVEPPPDAPPSSGPALPPSDAQAQAALAAIAAAGGHAAPVAEGSSDIAIDLSFAAGPIDDAMLASLRPLAPRVVALDLARTAVTDAGLVSLGEFTRLRRLSLAECAVTDAAAPALERLVALESLVVYHTRFGDAALARLASLPSLKRVYAWGAGVTPEGAARARALSPGLEVDLGAAAPAP